MEGHPSHLAHALLSGSDHGLGFHENDGKDEGKALEIGVGPKVEGCKGRQDASCVCEARTTTLSPG